MRIYTLTLYSIVLNHLLCIKLWTIYCIISKMNCMVIWTLYKLYVIPIFIHEWSLIIIHSHKTIGNPNKINHFPKGMRRTISIHFILGNPRMDHFSLWLSPPNILPNLYLKILTIYIPKPQMKTSISTPTQAWKHLH